MIADIVTKGNWWLYLETNYFDGGEDGEETPVLSSGPKDPEGDAYRERMILTEEDLNRVHE